LSSSATGFQRLNTRNAPHAASFADSRAEVVFHIAEEALRNTDRHAHAPHVDVALRDCDDASIELSIEDDGIGLDTASPHPGHYGLVGVREQAQLIDAERSLASTVQRGTSLRLRVGHNAKTPTWSGRLLLAEACDSLVAGAGFEPTTWVMSPHFSVRMCIVLRRS
jgi:nitrate/nitrite-specific signal transduction histidine kinase